MTNSYLRLMRPQQWAKNTFVFLPLFFSGNLMDMALGIEAIKAFAAFCLVASSIYCFNDIYDVEADRRHPKKRLRPVASGAVSVPQAYILMAVLALSGMALCLAAKEAWAMLGVVGFYYVMNLAYCTVLKRRALVDVFVIALGFVLRVLLGGLTTGIVLSHWIVIMTFLLALFLAFAKRRDDVVIYEGTGQMMRPGVNRYNLDFMNQAVTIVACITMVAYIMYTVSEDVVARIGSPHLYATSVFVLLGLLRYLQLTIVDVKSGSPTKVLMSDRAIQCCIAGWLLSFFLILYL